MAPLCVPSSSSTSSAPTVSQPSRVAVAPTQPVCFKGPWPEWTADPNPAKEPAGGWAKARAEPRKQSPEVGIDLANMTAGKRLLKMPTFPTLSGQPAVSTAVLPPPLTSTILPVAKWPQVAGAQRRAPGCSKGQERKGAKRARRSARPGNRARALSVQPPQAEALPGATEGVNLPQLSSRPVWDHIAGGWVHPSLVTQATPVPAASPSDQGLGLDVGAPDATIQGQQTLDGMNFPQDDSSWWLADEFLPADLALPQDESLGMNWQVPLPGLPVDFSVAAVEGLGQAASNLSSSSVPSSSNMSWLSPSQDISPTLTADTGVSSRVISPFAPWGNEGGMLLGSLSNDDLEGYKLLSSTGRQGGFVAAAAALDAIPCLLPTPAYTGEMSAPGTSGMEPERPSMTTFEEQVMAVLQAANTEWEAQYGG